MTAIAAIVLFAFFFSVGMGLDKLLQYMKGKLR